MISVVIKELKIKKELKEQFTTYIKNWIYISKQQELNLSIDGYWAGDKFTIIERWSSEDSFNKFTKLPEYTEFLKKIEEFVFDSIKVRKFKTIN
ncbi:hypothetical protein E1I18_02355 [Mycoplasmopsis mucosicanis]|uniref:ABM domain-containing protein n=1 Tax=Mycoplasmopsis mucosicanis TaxID=458208 RepID=A0A507SQS4_9BACT|nr:antibiotic biosynthesis monooxygenase [Mycoplasmopsis mucosicanis]TQC51503.1 hypothetical protein E1I18_02355 [Mycoplasmopsis mucosicanis]